MYYDQPMEDGIVTISRARGTVSYPAQFLLVSASNPCPCGYYGDAKRACKCLPGAISRYEKRVSGPILDRIDIHVEVPSVETQKLVGKQKGKKKVKDSKTIQKGVQAAREIQTKRFKEQSASRRIKANSEMSTKEVKKYCVLSPECITMLRSAVASMNITARSYFKVIKVARTIADLAGERKISTNHLAEALQYRPKESEY